jgi:hypothetical protein
MGGAFLEWALEAFSGYVAVDALSEGPSCGLSAVDNRQDKRVLDAVLHHAPNHDDLAALLGRVKTALDARSLSLKGITTAGSALSPAPIRTVCGEVPQQLGIFPIIKELTHGILRAVAKERRRLATSTPKPTRGRPASKDQEARRLARKSQDIQPKIRDVFQERLLCVQRHLTPSERQRFLHITRGVPPWRTLRESMDHLSALCDRRCRTQTALGKLKKLRQWVQRFQWMGETFKQVCAPHLAQALTFLDDKLLPSTSNAVERGNRRYRKMQKQVYRVRTQGC